MTVPDEAVEAAARAIYELKFGPEGWEGLPDKPRQQYTRDASVILKAATTAIDTPIEAELRKAKGTISTLLKLAVLSAKVGAMEKVQAWDEGWREAHGTDAPLMAGIFTNPYRSQDD